MNTDTNTTRKSHVRGAAAAVIAAAREERGLHQAKDVPSTYRVGREIIGTDGSMSGYGVAYPPKFAAAHMPFATTTRQLKRGFVILTEAEAAEIAVAYVAEDGRGVQAANERLASTRKVYGGYAEQYPDRAEDYASTIAHAEQHHAETIAKLAKARTRYGKLLATAQPATEEVTVTQTEAPEAKPTPEQESARLEALRAEGPSQADIDAAVTQLAAELGGTTDEGTRQRVAAAAATTPGTTVPVAQPLAEGELAELIRTKLATEEANTAALAAAAAAKVMADRAWRQAIVTAAAAGLSHRTIAAAAGCTHPTVAKVLAEESAR